MVKMVYSRETPSQSYKERRLPYGMTHVTCRPRQVNALRSNLIQPDAIAGILDLPPMDGRLS